MPSCANPQHAKFAAAGLPLCADCGIALQRQLHFHPKIPGMLRQIAEAQGKVTSGARTSGLVVVRNLNDERAALEAIAKGMKG